MVTWWSRSAAILSGLGGFRPLGVYLFCASPDSAPSYTYTVGVY